MRKTIFLDLETTGLNSSKDEILEIGIIDDDGKVLISALVKPDAQEWTSAQKIHGIRPDMVANAPTIHSLMPHILDTIADCRVVVYNAEFDSGFLINAINRWFESKIESTMGRIDQLGVLNTSMCGFVCSFWNIEFVCCMERFAVEYGEWVVVGQWQSYKWQKLEKAIRHIPQRFRDGVFVGDEVLSLSPDVVFGKPANWATVTRVCEMLRESTPISAHSAIFDAFACRAVWQWLDTQYTPGGGQEGIIGSDDAHQEQEK